MSQITVHVIDSRLITRICTCTLKTGHEETFPDGPEDGIDETTHGHLIVYGHKAGHEAEVCPDHKAVILRE
jgi:hypothetical protein